MHRLVVAWQYFTEAFLFLLYVRKDQVQDQSDWKLWFRCNKQKNDYLHWQLDFSSCNNVSFLGQNFMCSIYVAHFGFY